MLLEFPNVGQRKARLVVLLYQSRLPFPITPPRMLSTAPP